MEQTLVVFKPDAVQRGIVGEIINRFEKVGLKIVGIKMVQPDRDYYFHHYETIGKMISRHSEEIFNITLDMMMAGPVIAVVLEGVGAVEQVRKMVGPTEPKSAAPGTIRGDYAHISYSHADNLGIGITNIVHASGDANEAKSEIEHWFSGSEIYNHSVTHEKFTQPKHKPAKND